MAEGVFMIRLPMPFRMKYVNVFLFLEEEGFTLIDTGPNLPGVLPAMEKALLQLGQRLEDCRRILITHFHMDHCGLAGIIADRSGALISLSEIEHQTILTFSETAGRAERMKTFCAKNGFDKPSIEKITRAFLAFQKATSPFSACCYLSDGERLSVGGTEMVVVSTPGHSRGHLSFLMPKERLLIAGDHILPVITPNLSPDLLAPEFHPLESFLESLTKIETLEIETIWPSHGSPFKKINERIAEMREHHNERTKKTLRALHDGPKTASQVADFIFGNDLSVFDRFLALSEGYVHLLCLEKKGLIGRITEDDKDFFFMQEGQAI
jgi:glyoxylase-like metal-dependent hydrolase (beta-lactamase superfamily II)